MNIKLKSLHLENFKGAKDKTYEFGELTKVLGMNRLGKTTIATAWYWLLADKDYELHSNPNIRPDDAEECIPIVTAVLDVDGREITIAKMQKRSVSKPNDKGISKVTLTNTYEINAVPKNERDFKAYLEELGLAFDKFLVCSHPNVFTSQKTADMRNMLFKMASEKSDYDIAAMSAETADVAKLLVDYKYEEIEAMQKASKKKATEQVEAIPNQIVGLEKAKVDIDVAEQELAKAELERNIAEINSKIADSSKNVDALMQENLEVQFAINGIYTEANDKLTHERRKLEDAKYDLSRSFEDTHRNISEAEKKIEENKLAIEATEKKRSELGNKYKETSVRVFDETSYQFDEAKWVFDENSTICSLCGQSLPADKIAEIKADFEARKAKAKADAEKRLKDAKSNFDIQKKTDLEEIKAEGFKQKDIIDKLTDENASLQEKIKELKNTEIDLMKKQNEIAKQLAELPEKPDMSDNAEYQQLETKRTEIQNEIDRIRSSSNIADTLRTERDGLVIKLDAVKEIIAQAANNIRIDEQISELQEKQRDYEQVKADAEKILYQLSLVSKKKNELLVEEINNHFGIVKWLLFDYQKNGEYKEVCIPTVGGKRFGESTNTGREIEAKLDICNSFQKFFDMQLPIFLDGAESLNDCYMPKLDCQLITLNVTEDKELKVEVQ